MAEHFNYPWKMALKRGQFQDAGINLIWEDCPGGTGAMCEALRKDEIDLAVILTEGIIADILNGNPSRIVSSYVESPLIWGLHTSSKNELEAKDYPELPFAISRYNSGSHLMAYVHAQNRGWNIQDDQFNVVGSLEAALENLDENPEQLFLWEKFTTKPFVDNGSLKLIDECPTPWPSFLIVVRASYLEQNFDTVDAVLKIVEENAHELKSSAETPILISEEYGIKYEDAVAWFNNLVWQPNTRPNPLILSEVTKTLADLRVLDKALSPLEISKFVLANKASDAGLLI